MHIHLESAELSLIKAAEENVSHKVEMDGYTSKIVLFFTESDELFTHTLVLQSILVLWLSSSECLEHQRGTTVGPNRCHDQDNVCSNKTRVRGIAMSSSII